MTLTTESRPAVLGGSPIRPHGPPTWPPLDDQIQQVLRQLASSGDWGRYHGPHCPELVRQLAEYHSVSQVLPCSSGTAAVELALRGIGVTAGDEVVLADYDFKANFQNVICLGAVPVLIDVSAKDWHFDPGRLTSALSKKTRAVIVSHLHGGIVDMHAVCEWARANKIEVVEDACQNPGAIVRGRKAGTWGDVGVLSFGGSKLLTAGRGGAVITNRADIAERIKRYVQRGNDAYPLSEFQAAVITPQLARLDELNEVRRSAVAILEASLKSDTGLTFISTPAEQNRPAYYKVGIRFSPNEFDGLSRNQFAEAIRAEGIAIDPGFRSLHLIHASRRYRAADDLLEATKADAGMLTLHHPILMHGSRGIAEIVDAVRKIREHAGEIARALPHAC